MKLIQHSYGKAKVRVLKVFRAGAIHSIKELDVQVMLQGDFGASYTKSDNRLVVATDSIKNTVNVFAKQKLGAKTEVFGVALGEHFLKTYQHVRRVEVSLREHCWNRIFVGGKPHAHSFLEKSAAKPFAKIISTRAKTEVESGIEELFILKTTASGFENFLRDEFTTLPETSDRICATKLKATWTYAKNEWQDSRRDARCFCEKFQPVRASHAVSNGRGRVESCQRNFQNLNRDAEQALPVD
jgi:urate oxidase